METPTPTVPLEARQIWESTPSMVSPPHCTAFDLPANGILVLNASVTVTLQTDAIYQPFCTDDAAVDQNGTLPISDFLAPFVSSTVPQIFVIGAMLVISGILVIILIITPRTSFVIGNGTAFMGGRAILGGSYGSSSVIGVGGRPWLQKVAALLAFASLLVATINSFNLAASQYAEGYEDAVALTNDVVGSVEMRIIRVVSETFLWLAQVQTLIRLFPRRKEKVIIKWAGFALILLDTIFTILDNFVVSDDGDPVKPPRDFTNIISGLAYLFELALSLVYAASVLYYSAVKRRFSYYHEKMRNICVVALLSLVAIAIPIVFFVLDIAKPLLIGWGDYVRWVGAAAASVVVWEWVERIEALEREERKDGILGRQIFEGDELPDSTEPFESRWPRARRRSRGDFGGGAGTGLGTLPNNNLSKPSAVSTSRGMPTLMKRIATRSRPPKHGHSLGPRDENGRSVLNRYTGTGTIPADVPTQQLSPVPRSDTTSAASTVYAVIHHQDDGATNDSQQSRPNGDRASDGDVHPYSTLHPQASIADSQPSSEIQQQRNVAHRYISSRLPWRHSRPQSTSRSVPPTVSTTSTPSSASSMPSAGHSERPGSRRFSRLRRSPLAPEASDALPLFIIRNEQTDNGNLVIEQKNDSGNPGTPQAESTTPISAPSHLPGDLPSSANASVSSLPPKQSIVTATQPFGVSRYSSPGSLRAERQPPQSHFPDNTQGPSSHFSSPDHAFSGPNSPNAESAAATSLSGSRNSRRTPPSMPVLQEVESHDQTSQGGLDGS